MSRCDQRHRGHKCTLLAQPGVTDRKLLSQAHKHKCLCGHEWVCRHPYKRAPFAADGRCWCGRSSSDEVHKP